MKITNNTILITGGGSGIGRALTEELYNNNKLIVVGRSRSKLERLKNLLPKITCYPIDLSQPDELTELAHLMKRNHPDLNAIINNAGTLFVEDLCDTANVLDKERSQIQLNYLTPIQLINDLLELLRQQKEAAIVNVSTALVHVPLVATPGYCASKTALHIYTMGLREQLRNTAIQVHEILPPIVSTDMSSLLGIEGISPKVFARKVVEQLSQGVPEIRVGQAKALYLMSRYFPKFIQGKMNRKAMGILQR